MPDEQDTPAPEPTPEDAAAEQAPEPAPEPSAEQEPGAEAEAGQEPAPAAESQPDAEQEVEGSEEEAAALAAAMAAINQVQGVADSAGGAPDAAADGAKPFTAPELDSNQPEISKGEIDLLSDVHMDVRIELGRTRMFVEDVLKLGDGAVVELDKLAGDPVDVFVNNRRVARGEVLVLNDLFCVRINEVVDIAESED